MIIKGKVWKVGEDINTDAIAPSRYNLDTREVQAAHCLESADPEFAKKAKPGDIIVAGKNFGCGSSRERAPQCIQDFGIAAIVAPSYARIFMRNAINIGLTILEADEAPSAINEGDVIEIDTASGTIKDVTTGATLNVSKFPPFLQSIIDSGGLVPYARRKLGTSA